MKLVHRMTLAAVAGLFAPFAVAADLLVPQDFPTIQAAVDQAGDGDRVLISPGRYVESVDVAGKQITIEGESGAEVTELAGEGAVGFLLRVDGAGSQLELRGLRLTGGFGEAGSDGAGPGGGLLVDGAAVSVHDCEFVDNAGITGGAIQVIGGSLAVQNSRFAGNTALHGGAIFLEASAGSIVDSEFSDNEATNFGGALAVFVSDEFVLRDTELTDNTAGSFGGALYTQHAHLDLSGLLAVGNGRAEFTEHGGWVIQTSGGGAVYATESTGRIQASRFRENVAAAGSALYIAGDGELELVNNLMAQNGNECNCGQGVVYANSASPILVNNTIVDNGGLFGLFTTYNAFPVVRNSILATRPEGSGPFAPVGGNGLSDVDFSLLQGQSGGAELGGSTVVVEQFPSLDLQGDYAPLEGSVVVDAGSNEAVPADITSDLLGNARIVAGSGEEAIVDLGAIELVPAAVSDTIMHHRFSID